MAKISINLKDGTIDEAKDIIIGIDLGTTNSLVAYVADASSDAYVVKDAQGKNSLTPSVIHFAQDGSIEVGNTAKEKLELFPERTIYSVKRLMGKSSNDLEKTNKNLAYRIIEEDTDDLVKIQVGEQFHTPISLSAEILKHLKEKIELELGQAVQKAVITVPAYFNDTQRQATRDAGKLAGLDVLRIVNEPTAAALAYGIGLRKEDEKTVAIYDLGGGTFDVSILSIHDGIFDVLSTHGDTVLGGDDFDNAIIQYWKDNNDWSDIDWAINKQAAQSIRLAAEEAKKALSAENLFEIKVLNTKLSLDRSTFNQLCKALIQRTLDACNQALKDANLQPSDIDDVIMVGGSTRVPAVQNAVQDFFGKSLNNSLNPDEVVALGAAVQASVLAGKQEGILLLDITPLSLGIETVGGLMDVIISRNSKIPCSLAREYTTSVDGQTKLSVTVYQGERDLVQHNRKLGAFILKGIPPMPAGIPKIQISFLLDADGILIVRAKELRSNVEQSITIQSQYGISEEDMARMLLDSIQNAKADMDTKAVLEATNEANNIILHANRFIKQHTSWLDSEQLERIQAHIQQLQSAIDQADKDQINKAITEINDYTNPLAEIAMNRAIQDNLKGKEI